MKFKFVLTDGSIVTGDEVDYYNNNVRVIDMNKPDDNSEIENCTFSVYMICPESIVYSSCEHMTYEEYLDYLDSCESEIETGVDNKQPCSCETCEDCDCESCEEMPIGNYEVTDTSKDNNMYM